MDGDRDRIVRELSRMIGDGKVSSDPILIRLHSRNAVYHEGDAIAVVYPESREDVVSIVRYAYRNDLKIYPQGAQSEIVGSTTPRGDGIIVSFMRMNRVKEVNTIDGYVVCEPGVRLIELDNVLSRHGYMFPIDPASVKSATVGGAINSGSGGMMGAKYGSIKDWVLGLEVVLPDEDASILRLGGVTTKNREGYDLIRLIIGSEGTLALVTEAILRITIRPERVITVAGFFEDIDGLMDTVVDIKGRRLDILLMEFVDDRTAELTMKTVGSRISGEGHLLITSIATTDESWSKVLREVEDAYRRNNASKMYSASTWMEAEDLGLYDIRRNYYPASIEIASRERPDPEARPLVFVEDISVPPTRLAEAIRRIRELGDRYRVSMTLGGHVGDGNIHPVVWLHERDEEGIRRFRDFVHGVMRIALEMGGVVSSEHGIGTDKMDGLRMAYEYRDSVKAIELMRNIKRIFDPKGILNPGKLF